VTGVQRKIKMQHPKEGRNARQVKKHVSISHLKGVNRLHKSRSSKHWRPGKARSTSGKEIISIWLGRTKKERDLIN
jgi:hypothetical protein